MRISFCGFRKRLYLCKLKLKKVLEMCTQEQSVDETMDGFPCLYTEEEAIAIALQRGREIKEGRAKLIPHEAVVHEMEELLATYAD